MTTLLRQTLLQREPCGSFFVLARLWTVALMLVCGLAPVQASPLASHRSAAPTWLDAGLDVKDGLVDMDFSANGDYGFVVRRSGNDPASQALEVAVTDGAGTERRFFTVPRPAFAPAWGNAVFLDMLDKDKGYLLVSTGADWRLFQTTSTGLTWESVGAPILPLSPVVRFAVAKDGVLRLLCQKGLMRSSDGGATWRQEAFQLEDGANLPASLSFKDLTTLPSGKVVLLGAVKEKENNPVPAVLMSMGNGGWTFGGVPAEPAVLTALQFANDQVGYAVGHQLTTNYAGGTGQACRDCHQTQAAPLNDGGLDAPDLPSGVLRVKGGVVYKTVDGGKSWSSTYARTDQVLKALAFRGPERGYFAGSDGLILTTVDGASTLEKEFSTLDATIQKIQLSPLDHIFALTQKKLLINVLKMGTLTHAPIINGVLLPEVVGNAKGQTFQIVSAVSDADGPTDMPTRCSFDLRSLGQGIQEVPLTYEAGSNPACKLVSKPVGPELAPGVYTINVSTKDHNGLTGAYTLYLKVIHPGTPPTLTLSVDPPDLEAFRTTLVTFTGAVSAPDGVDRLHSVCVLDLSAFGLDKETRVPRENRSDTEAQCKGVFPLKALSSGAELTVSMNIRDGRGYKAQTEGRMKVFFGRGLPPAVSGFFEPGQLLRPGSEPHLPLETSLIAHVTDPDGPSEVALCRLEPDNAKGKPFDFPVMEWAPNENGNCSGKVNLERLRPPEGSLFTDQEDEVYAFKLTVLDKSGLEGVDKVFLSITPPPTLKLLLFPSSAQTFANTQIALNPVFRHVPPDLLAGSICLYDTRAVPGRAETSPIITDFGCHGGSLGVGSDAKEGVYPILLSLVDLNHNVLLSASSDLAVFDVHHPPVIHQVWLNPARMSSSKGTAFTLKANVNDPEGLADLEPFCQADMTELGLGVVHIPRVEDVCVVQAALLEDQVQGAKTIAFSIRDLEGKEAATNLTMNLSLDGAPALIMTLSSDSVRYPSVNKVGVRVTLTDPDGLDNLAPTCAVNAGDLSIPSAFEIPRVGNLCEGTINLLPVLALGSYPVRVSILDQEGHKGGAFAMLNLVPANRQPRMSAWFDPPRLSYPLQRKTMLKVLINDPDGAATLSSSCLINAPDLGLENVSVRRVGNACDLAIQVPDGLALGPKRASAAMVDDGGLQTSSEVSLWLENVHDAPSLTLRVNPGEVALGEGPSTLHLAATITFPNLNLVDQVCLFDLSEAGGSAALEVPREGDVCQTDFLLPDDIPSGARFLRVRLKSAGDHLTEAFAVLIVQPKPVFHPPVIALRVTPNKWRGSEEGAPLSLVAEISDDDGLSTVGDCEFDLRELGLPDPFTAPRVDNLCSLDVRVKGALPRGEKSLTATVKDDQGLAGTATAIIHVLDPEDPPDKPFPFVILKEVPDGPAGDVLLTWRLTESETWKEDRFGFVLRVGTAEGANNVWENEIQVRVQPGETVTTALDLPPSLEGEAYHWSVLPVLLRTREIGAWAEEDAFRLTEKVVVNRAPEIFLKAAPDTIDPEHTKLTLIAKAEDADGKDDLADHCVFDLSALGLENAVSEKRTGESCALTVSLPETLAVGDYTVLAAIADQSGATASASAVVHVIDRRPDDPASEEICLQIQPLICRGNEEDLRNRDSGNDFPQVSLNMVDAQTMASCLSAVTLRGKEAQLPSTSLCFSRSKCPGRVSLLVENLPSGFARDENNRLTCGKDLDASSLHNNDTITCTLATQACADPSGDGEVDLEDFGIMKQEFGLVGRASSGAALRADLNGDGEVDLQDFALLRQFFQLRTN